MDLSEPVLLTPEGLERLKAELEVQRARRLEAADRLTNLNDVVRRFNVNIRSSVPHCLGQNTIDDLYHWRVVCNDLWFGAVS